jgi:hypothetical protein
MTHVLLEKDPTIRNCLIVRHVEARGVEPLSSRLSNQTSTCLAGHNRAGDAGQRAAPALCIHEIFLALRYGCSTFRPACCRRSRP